MLGRATSGDLSITIDGVVWRLVLDVNALIDFQSVTGKDPFTVLEEIDNGTVDLSLLRALLWAALQEHHPGTDLRAAGRLLQAAPAALGDLLNASLPAPGPDEGKPMPPKVDAV